MLGFALLAPASARAEDVNPAALVAARELFRQATEDVDAGRFAAALEKFKRVAAVKETPAVRFNVARCEESLGKTGAALADFELAEREAKSDPQHQADDVAKLAHDRADAVRPKVPRLAIQPPAPMPAGMTVSLDGEKIGDATLGVPLPVDPGVHVVDASAPGAAPFRSEVRLAAGEAKSVPIVLNAATGGAGGSGDPADDAARRGDEEAHLRSSSQRTWGWIAIAGGGALAVGSVLFVVQHNSAVSDLDTLCPNGACRTKDQQTATDTQSKARTDQTVSIALGAAAAVALATGVVLVLTAPKSGQPAPTALVVPGAPSAAAGLSLHVTF